MKFTLFKNTIANCFWKNGCSWLSWKIWWTTQTYKLSPK